MNCSICRKEIDGHVIQTQDGPQHFFCFAENQQPDKPGYFPPYDDLGNRRTINNAVDCGWSAI